MLDVVGACKESSLTALPLICFSDAPSQGSKRPRPSPESRGAGGA